VPFTRATTTTPARASTSPPAIGALAAAGEILVSKASLDGGSRFTLSEPRSETLKGFDEPIELVALEWR
jgi:hypothetical protein